MIVGLSSRIQNRSILYRTIVHIPEKVPMRRKFHSYLVSTKTLNRIIFFTNNNKSNNKNTFL